MKIGFFFGAGAEVGYGLPSGGKFAIDLFRQDVGPHKTALRAQLNSISSVSTYATSWLPEKFSTQRIHAFGKNEFTSLIESSIEYKKSEIIKRLNNFDEEADKAILQLNIDKNILRKKFNGSLSVSFGEQLYSSAVRLNPILSQEVKLFGSEFYSAMLTIIAKQKDTAGINRYAGAFLQLLVGAHGQDLVQRLNQELFEAAPDDIPIFDDVTGMFKLEFSRAGLTALELLLEPQPSHDIENCDLAKLIATISQQILENLFTTVLDYQSLIDSHFRYLFSPKTEWAKFTKMVIFLRAAREYIGSQLAQSNGLSSDGYYHDLVSCHELGVEISAVGTANYNNLIESLASEIGCTIPPVKHLNGSVTDYYNPFKNSVISCAKDTDVPSDEIFVPFILTQSGLKPLTSIDMSRRYVSLYDDYLKCNGIIVIGYGFNIDDSHINGLFRQLIEDGEKKIYWICRESDGTMESQKRNLVRRLRISSNHFDKVVVVPVDTATRKRDDMIWLEYVVNDLTKSS